MLHVLVALYILGALLGVAAAMFVNHHRVVYRLEFLGPFARVLLFFSVLMLVLVSTYYGTANLGQYGARSSTSRLLGALFNNFVGFVAFSGWLVSFLQVLRGFEGKGLAPASRRLLTALVAGTCCSYAIGFGISALGGTGAWLGWSRNAYNLAVPVLLLCALAELLWRIPRTDFVVPRRSVRAFTTSTGSSA